MLTSWTHLLERLEGAVDEHTTIAVQQLRGLTKMKTEDAFPPFHPLHPDELDPKIPRRLFSLQRLVDAATTRAIKDKYASEPGSVTTTYASYGRYLSIADAAAWFGIEFECWAEDSYPNTSLWLCFNEEWREKSRPFGEIRRALEPLEWKAEENGVLFVPIELPVQAEYDAVLEAVVIRLQEVSDLNQCGRACVESNAVKRRIERGSRM